MVSSGLTVVFSPLIALIHDQVTGLRSMGIAAESLSSATPGEEVGRIWRDVHSGHTKMLYVTPERYGQVPSFKDHLISLHRENKIRAFVIDEGKWTSDAQRD